MNKKTVLLTAALLCSIPNISFSMKKQLQKVNTESENQTKPPKTSDLGPTLMAIGGLTTITGLSSLIGGKEGCPNLVEIGTAVVGGLCILKGFLIERKTLKEENLKKTKSE